MMYESMKKKWTEFGVSVPQAVRHRRRQSSEAGLGVALAVYEGPQVMSVP